MPAIKFGFSYFHTDSYKRKTKQSAPKVCLCPEIALFWCNYAIASKCRYTFKHLGLYPKTH